jgi:hypothetical protein
MENGDLLWIFDGDFGGHLLGLLDGALNGLLQGDWDGDLLRLLDGDFDGNLLGLLDGALKLGGRLVRWSNGCTFILEALLGGVRSLKGLGLEN